MFVPCTHRRGGKAVSRTSFPGRFRPASIGELLCEAARFIQSVEASSHNNGTDLRLLGEQTGSNAEPVVGSLRFLGFAAKRSSITSLRLLVSRKLDSQSFAQWTKAAWLEIVC